MSRMVMKVAWNGPFLAPAGVFAGSERLFALGDEAFELRTR